MNTTLPPDRDLPPHAHARIRSRVELEASRRRRPWLLPVAAGLAVVVLAAFFAWPQPDRPDTRPAGPPAAQVPAPGKPEVPGVSPQRRAEIEERCAYEDHPEKHQVTTLYRLTKDAAGEAILTYRDDGVTVLCTEDLNTTMLGDTAPLHYLPGPLSWDAATALSGGDAPREEMDPQRRPGVAGVETVAGRVTPEVARVTYTSTDGATQEGEIVDGTFVVRLLRPSHWKAPVGPNGIVRAFDAEGTQLVAVSEFTRLNQCYVAPDGTVFPHGTTGKPPACKPGVRWH
jgi:hypothetical protein